MFKALPLLLTAVFGSCATEVNRPTPELDRAIATVVSPTPSSIGDLADLKQFAEKYEPKSGREVIPSPPILDPNLTRLAATAARAESRAHEPYVVLIFLKLSRFHLENFKQSYELGRDNPLTKEFYRLIGQTNYYKAERIASSLAENYVKNHPELLEYAPIKAEVERIAGLQKIER